MDTFDLSLCSRWMASGRQEEWERFTGQAPDEYQGWGWLNAIHAEDRATVVQKSGRARATGRAMRFDYRLRQRRGGFRRVEVRADPMLIPEQQDAPVGWKARHRPSAVTGPAEGDDSLMSWRSVADQLHEGVVTADARGRIAFVNAAARELHGVEELGVDPEKYADRYRLYTLAGEPYPSTELPLARAVLSGEVVRDALWVIRREDGTERIVQGDAGPLRNHAGEQVGSLLTCRDVTDMHRAGAAREREHQVFEQVFMDSPVCKVLLEGPDHRFKLVNSACRRLVGDRNVLGMPVREAIPEPEAQPFRDILDAVRATGEPYRAEGLPITLGHRSEEEPEERYVDFTCQPLKDTRGEVWAILVTGSEVTLQVTQRREQERLQEELFRSTADLRERDARFTEIAETFDGVIWTTSPGRSKIEYLSPSFERIWGRSRAEVYEDPGVWLATIHPEDRATMARLPADQQKGPNETEYRILRPDGEVRWIRGRSSPARDEDGSVRRIVGVSEDITEEVLMRKNLERSERMSALGSMAGRVAHDFNNIITSITGMAELACDGLPEGPVRDDVMDIIANSRRAAALTAQLTAFSRNEEERSTATVDLRAHVGELRRMLHVLLGREHELVIEMEDVETLVRCTPSEIDQIATNLVANARDAVAGSEGRLCLRTRVFELPGDSPEAVRRRSIARGRWVHLEISDNGRGMDESTAARIFEPFFTTKGRGNGTGLGLSTVFGIVTGRGGSIWVDTELGRGTTFHIVLPVASRPDDVDVAPTLPETAGAREGRTGTILVVDDDESIRRIVVRCLEREGYTLIAAGSPEMAIDLVRGKRGGVDLVLSDIGLPGLSVGQMLSRLQEEVGEVPVLLISGFNREDVEAQGIAPDTPFLAKPFELDDLRRALESAMHGRATP